MLDDRSKYLRRQIIRALVGGGRGHVGPSFSLVEIMRVLYDDVIQPEDIVILSKGHGCLAQYVMLVEKGFIPATELDRFCREGALLGGHSEHHIPGIPVSTGSLGHGLSLGIGFALADRKRRVFVIVGDGECDEGSIWEAALCAGKHKLSNLTVIVDYNGLQSYGPVDEVQPLEPLAKKWESFGFVADEIDGHNLYELDRFLSWSWKKGLPPYAHPHVVIAHTNKPLPHHKDTFTAEDAAQLEATLA